MATISVWEAVNTFGSVRLWPGKEILLDRLKPDYRGWLLMLQRGEMSLLSELYIVSLIVRDPITQVDLNRASNVGM